MSGNKLRTITFRQKEYKWAFSNRWIKTESQHHFQSTLRIWFDKKQVVVICFKTNDTYTCGAPLNEGAVFFKENEQKMLNLNQPGCVAEILEFIMDHDMAVFSDKQVISLDGKELFEQLGYQDTGGIFI